MTKKNAETGEKNKSFWVADVKNIVAARFLFIKFNIKESYEYPNLIYSIELMLMKKKNSRKSHSLL